MTASGTVWALIPVKGRGGCKSRLAGVLSAGEREALVDTMFRHVVSAATEARSIERTVLVGPPRHEMDAHILLLDEPGGLNEALTSALAKVATSEFRPDRVVIVAADLPCLTALDLDLLANAPHRSLAIAPDRHGTGTNALSLPLPEAAGFRFQYGIDSAALHRHEAERLGLSVETILSAGLEKDIDEPADLPDAAQVYSIGR